MEKAPNMQWHYDTFKETRSERNRRIIQERITAERRRLAVMLELSHRAVNMSLRSERNKTVRATVRGQLQRQYGMRTPGWSPGFSVAKTWTPIW